MRTPFVLLISAGVAVAARPFGGGGGALNRALAWAPRRSADALTSSIKAILARGGGSKSDDEIEDLRQKIIDEGVVIPEFGVKADIIVNEALAAVASSETGSSDDYDRSLQELEASLDAKLHVLYMKQLGYLREAALQRYRSSKGDYEAMLQADSQFIRDAEDATREGSDWDYTAERAFLQAVMNLTADSKNRADAVQLNAAQQQQTAMQFLQSQQQMIQQLQMQLYGQTSPWNVGVAYRIPDTNFNLQGSYQQGRANVQLSCVPDEYAPFLGPNGFTNGVGPGNLGLSLNLSI